MYTNIYTCIHIYIHINIYIYMQIYICMYTHVYIYMYMYIYMYVFIHIYTYTYVYTYINTFIYMYSHVCMYIDVPPKKAQIAPISEPQIACTQWQWHVITTTFCSVHLKYEVYTFTYSRRAYDEFTHTYRTIHIECTHCHPEHNMQCVSEVYTFNYSRRAYDELLTSPHADKYTSSRQQHAVCIRSNTHSNTLGARMMSCWLVHTLTNIRQQHAVCIWSTHI